MKKNIFTYALIVMIVAGVAFGTKMYIQKTAFDTSSTESSKIGYSNESQMPNFSDERILLGHNHVSFVGKVLQRVGNKVYPSSKAPSTQFEIRVIYNVKGALRGIVTISQFEFVSPQIETGSTYLFTARYSESTGWYTFGVPETYKLLSADETLSDADLKSFAENNEKVVAMQKAYPDEILSYGDRKYHTTYNSYVSRRYDASGNLIDDTVELHKRLETAAAASSTPESPSPTPESTTAPSDEAGAASVTPSPIPTDTTPIPTPDISPTPLPSDSPVPTAP